MLPAAPTPLFWEVGGQPPLFVFDTFGGYGYLYIGSFGIGLAAVAIALAFPTTRAAPSGRPQPA